MASIYMGNMARHRRILSDCANVSAAQKSVDFNIESYKNSPMYPFEETYSSIRDPAHADYISTDDAKTTSFTFKENGEASRENSSSSGCSSLIPHQQDQKSCHFQDSPNLSSHLQRKQKHLRQNTSCPNIIEEDIDGADVHIDNGKNCNFSKYINNDFALHQHVGIHDEKNEANSFSIPPTQSSSQIKNNFPDDEEHSDNNPSSSPKEAFVNTGKKLISSTFMKFLRGSHMCAAPPSLTSDQQNPSSKKKIFTTVSKKAISNPVTPQDTATDTEGGTKTNIIKCKANGEIPNQKHISMNGSANPIPNGHLPNEYLNISTAPRILRENWLFFLEKVPIIHWVKKWVILDEVSLLIFPTRPINTTLNKSITPNGLHDISYIDESNIPKLLSFINNTSEDDEGGQDNAMRTFSLKIPAPLGNLQNVIGNYTPPFQEPNDTTSKNDSSPHKKANQGKDHKSSIEQNSAQNSTLMYSFALEIETTTMVTTLNPDVAKNCNGQEMNNPPVPLCNSTPNAKNIRNNNDQNQKSMRRKRKKLEYLTMATMNGAERDEWVKTFSWIISHHRTLALKARQKQTFTKNLTQPTLNYNGQQSNNKASVNGLHSTNHTNNVNNNNPIHNVSPIEPSPRFRERCKTEISIKRNSVLQSQQQNNIDDNFNQNTTDYLTLKRENSRQRDLQSSPLKEDLILILIRNRRELSKLKQELSDIVQAQSSLQYTNANTLSSQNMSSSTLQNDLKCLSENKQTIRQKIQKYEAVISTLEGLLKQTDTYSDNKKENTTFVSSTQNNTTNISYKYPQYNHQYHLSDISPHTNLSNQNGRQQTLHNDLCNKANSSDQTCQMSLPNYREQILMLDKLAMDYQKLIDDVTSLTIRTYPQFLARYNCIGEEIKENLQILGKIGGNNESSQTFDHNMLARRERIAHIQGKLEMLKTKAHKFYNQREEMLLNTTSAENTATPQRSVLHNLAPRTTFKNGKDENCANHYTNNRDRVEHNNNNLHKNYNLNNRFDKNNYLHYSQNVRNGIYESSERHENIKEFNKPNGHNTATNNTNLNSQRYEFDLKMSTAYHESQMNQNSKNNFILADKNVNFDRNGINYGNNSESPVTLQRIRMGHHGIKQNFDHLPSTLRRSLKNRSPQEVSFESDCHIPRVLRRAHNANECEQKRKNRSQSVPPPDTVEEMLYERKSPPDASNNRPNAQSDHANIQNERNRKSSLTVNKGSMYDATFQPYSAQPTLSNPQSHPMYISYQNNQTTTTMESTHNNNNNNNAKCGESKLTPPHTYYHVNCDKNLPNQFYSNEGRRPSCSKGSEFIEHTVDRNGQIDSSRHQTNVYYMRAYGRCSPSTPLSPKSPNQEREERKCSINDRNFPTNYPQLHQLNANSPMVETYKDLNVLSIKETPIEQISAYPPNNYYQAQQTQSSTPGNQTKTVILVEPKCKTAGGKGANPKIFTKESSPCSLANSVYSAEIGLETIDQELSRPQKINIPERLRDEELVLCELMANQANLTPANDQAGFDSLTQTQINEYILAQKNYATSCGLDSPKQHSTSASLSLDSSTPPLANKTHHHHSARNNESVFAPLKVQIPPPPPLLHTNDNIFLRTLHKNNINKDQRSLTTTDYNNNNIEAYWGDKILSPLYKDEKLNHTNHVSPEEKETKERVKAAIKKEYLKNLLSNYGSHDLSPQIAHGRTTSSPYVRSSLSSSTNDSPNVNHQRLGTDFACFESNMNNSYHKTYHMNGGDKPSPSINNNQSQSNDFTGERALSHNGHSNSWLEEERCRREKLLNLNELLAKEVAAKTRKMMLNNALSRDMANETSLSSPPNQSGPKKFENYIPFTNTVKEEDQNNGPRTDIDQFLHYNYSESNGF